MPKISKEQAQKILEKHGYKVLDYLGKGAASYVFEASRKSKKGGEKLVAAKVCCLIKGSWASLKDELEAAKELKGMKDKFKANLAEAQQNGQTALAEKYKKNLKYLFKYLTVPKLKLHVPKETVDDGKDYEIAIFEAPLAGYSIHDWIVGGYDLGKVKVTVMPYPNIPNWSMCVVSDVDVNYDGLKKVIKSILKGLKVLHDQGMRHGDIAFRSILKKFNVGKGKYEYSITNFGTLKPGGPFIDLRDASQLLLCLWLVCVGMNSYSVEKSIFPQSPEYFYSDTFEKNGVENMAIPKEVPKPNNPSLGVYFPTKEDMKLVNFCKKLYYGGFKSADEALADPWLN